VQKMSKDEAMQYVKNPPQNKGKGKGKKFLDPEKKRREMYEEHFGQPYPFDK